MSADDEAAWLLTAPRAELNAYTLGRRHGYLEGEVVGYDRGWQACDDEISALQRAAAHVVHTLARIDPHDVTQDRRRQHQLKTAARHAANRKPWPEQKDPTG